jgi:hypothetical protein
MAEKFFFPVIFTALRESGDTDPASADRFGRIRISKQLRQSIGAGAMPLNPNLSSSVETCARSPHHPLTASRYLPRPPRIAQSLIRGLEHCFRSCRALD